jgi:hypothetical protein
VTLPNRPHPLSPQVFVATVAFYVPSFAGAQALDVLVDTSFGTGVTLTQGDGETVGVRSPVYADVDVGLVTDRDFGSEWGLGLTFQLEDAAAVALTPQVRLVRGDEPLRFYGGIGAPVFVTPDTLFGAELAGGVIYALADPFALIGGVQVDVFFAGGDLPDGGALTMFNLGVGGRIAF